jgi:hypothetical protein
MRLLTALAFFCLTTPAIAQDVQPYIDFDALFADKADQIKPVEGRNGVTKITLPGPVVVFRNETDGAPVYSTVDQTPQGPVACMIEVLASIASLETCEGALTDARKEAVANGLDKLASYTADNTYPPVAAADREDFRATFLAELASRQAPNARWFCSTVNDDEGVALFVQDFADTVAGDGLSELLETPRLPALNPC